MLSFKHTGAPPTTALIPIYQRADSMKISSVINGKKDTYRMIKGWETSDDNYSILRYYGGDVITNDSPIQPNFHVTHNRKAIATQQKKLTARAIFNSRSFSQCNQANKGNYS